jgi:NAD(P)-dependent dehydrogenase (short-subunit alcohol dehydrogenase family)
MSARLAGKVALITGAASGIGAATARRFVREGAAVIAADLTDASGLAAELRGSGAQALAVQADVTSAASLAAAVERGREEFGRIDVLVANAGIAGLGTTLDCDPAEWARVIDVNLTGAWLSMRAVLPTMIAQGSGSIVLTASIAGVIGVGGIAPYTAAKAGVIGLARSTAIEVAAAGIRVNALAPGTSPTPLVLDTFATLVGRGGRADEERTQRALAREQQRYPMGRFGELDEIAAVALFLASDDSSWVTGTVQVVDGGLSAA